MKIIHCADIHIGSVLKNISAEKSRIRKREIIDSFFGMLGFAEDNDVRAIIIAGDFFDGKNIARQTRKELLDKIASLPQIDFLYLTGNHDYQIKLDDNELTLPPNLKMLASYSDWTYIDYGDICVAGIDIIKQEGYAFYNKLNFDKHKFNIAVLHGDLQTIQLEKLRDKNIDYLALGDIHIPDIEPKRLDMRGVYAYSGCLEGRGFDEAGERGFFLLEVVSGKLKREFHTVAKRRYEVVEVDITNLDTHSKIDDEIRTKTRTIGKDNIVKVSLIGRRNAETQIERKNLETKLKGGFFYAKVQDNSSLEMDSVDFANEVSLRSEFVNLVKESELDDIQKDKILEYGIKALYGEAIDI